MKHLTFAIDFDGTLAGHEYPNIGKENPLAFETLQKLRKLGHKIILYTMRSGKELNEAVNWCRDKGFVFDDINENQDQKAWTESPKIYANVYIDDAALGCPLMKLKDTERPVVNWEAVNKYLEVYGVHS